MKTKMDPASPFGITLWMSNNEIDTMCARELKKSSRYLPDKPEPVNIERFIESYLGITIDYKDLEAGYLGCAQFDNSGRPIRIIISSRLLDDSKPSERRLRSTLAHEAGHCLFHPVLFMAGNPQSRLFDEDVNREKRMILCRDGIVGGGNGYDGRWWEVQANRAIGGFLLPKELVELSLDGLLNRSPITGLTSLLDSSRGEAVRVVSEAFEVNPVVAKIRLDAMYPQDDTQMTF